jgi:hypothetical protein
MPAAVMCPRVSAEPTRLLVCYRYAHEMVARPCDASNEDQSSPAIQLWRGAGPKNVGAASHGWVAMMEQTDNDC